MCTASWRWEHGKPELWFNRDEQRSRPAALPPYTVANGATYPIDPQGGGTWVFVNRHGLIAALLNGYTPSPPGPLRSRGLLLRNLSDCEDPETVFGRLQELLRRDRYASFFLIALRDSVRVWHWDGYSLEAHQPEGSMLTTSSVETETVLAARHAYYAACVRDPKNPTRSELEAFHAWHDPCRQQESVRMSREDAQTVSVSRIRNGRFDYWHSRGSLPDET